MMRTDPVSASIGECVQGKRSWIRYDSAGSLAGNNWRACTMKRTLWRARKEKKLNVRKHDVDWPRIGSDWRVCPTKKNHEIMDSLRLRAKNAWQEIEHHFGWLACRQQLASLHDEKNKKFMTGSKRKET